MGAQGSMKRSTTAEMRMGKNTVKYVKFNRGPQGDVGITCEQFGFCVKITGLTPGGPALNSGKLAVGDLIESVDDEYLASLSLDQIGQRLKGQPGSMITLHVHSEKAVPDPPPATLVLSGEIKHQGLCLGAYKVVPGRSVHGRPVWRQDARHERGDRYIAHLACGNWAVQKEDKVGFNEGALLYLADASVMYPHQSRVVWQEVDDKGRWFDGAGLKCDASARWTNTWENRSVTLTRGSTPPVPHASQPQLPQTPGKHCTRATLAYAYCVCKYILRIHMRTHTHT